MGSSPGKMTLTFTLERSGSLIIPLFLSCCSFPLTFTTGNGSTQKYSRKPPEFQILSPWLHCAITQFPLGDQDQSLHRVISLFFCLFVQWHKDPKRAKGQSHLLIQCSHCCVPPSGNTLPLRTKISKPAEPSVLRTRQQKFCKWVIK